MSKSNSPTLTRQKHPPLAKITAQEVLENYVPFWSRGAEQRRVGKEVREVNGLKRFLFRQEGKWEDRSKQEGVYLKGDQRFSLI